MIEELEVAKFNLISYPHIKEFFGTTIYKNSCKLLVTVLADESNKQDIKRLEHALEIGKKYCTNFETIFKERKLKNNNDTDIEVLNSLAEVRAFEFLYYNNFGNIIKVKHKLSSKTVDFTATRSEQNYAIEVTRLGVPQSNRKQPVYMLNEPEVRMVFGPTNVPTIGNLIRDTIDREYSQIKAFCEAQNKIYKGILVISSGHDYLINENAPDLIQFTPNSTLEALQQEWQLIKQEQRFTHLNHIIIIMAKTKIWDWDKTIVFPSID